MSLTNPVEGARFSAPPASPLTRIHRTAMEACSRSISMLMAQQPGRERSNLNNLYREFGNEWDNLFLCGVGVHAVDESENSNDNHGGRRPAAPVPAVSSTDCDGRRRALYAGMEFRVPVPRLQLEAKDPSGSPHPPPDSARVFPGKRGSGCPSTPTHAPASPLSHTLHQGLQGCPPVVPHLATLSHETSRDVPARRVFRGGLVRCTACGGRDRLRR